MSCSNVQMFICSYVHMFKCLNVQMFKCLGESGERVENGWNGEQCEIARVTTDTLTADSDRTVGEDSQESMTSGQSADTVLTQISRRPVEKLSPSSDGEKKKKKVLTLKKVFLYAYTFKSVFMFS